MIRHSPLRRGRGDLSNAAREAVAWLRSTAAIAALAPVQFAAPTPALAVNAYITNTASNNVSVIDTTTNTVIGSPTHIGSRPAGVAVTLGGNNLRNQPV